MATINIRNIKDLELVLGKAIEDAMTNEVLDETKKIIKDKVETVVYNAGTPKEYTRRNFSSGSLGDLDMIEHRYKDDVLEVANEADFHHGFAQDPDTWGYGAVDRGKSLTYNIEHGYGSKDKWYNKPRRFMGETKKELQDGKFRKALVKGLRRLKIKAK